WAVRRDRNRRDGDGAGRAIYCQRHLPGVRGPDLRSADHARKSPARAARIEGCGIAGMSRTINVTLNGTPVAWQVEDYQTLLHVLREVAHLYGAREGCGQGVCGACTVLVDGQPASSCLALAPLVDGCSITT